MLFHRLAARILATLVLAPALSAEPIDALWVGGDGLWADPAGWAFGEPTTPSFPANSVDEEFAVGIDGAAATASSVLLDQDVSITSLALSSGDALGVTGALRLGSPTGLAISLHNDGAIGLDGGAARIDHSSDLTISGTGEIVLGGAGNALGSLNAPLINGESHTIRGAGSIGSTLTNRGLLLADVPGVDLVVEERLTNEGVVRTAGGRLDFGRLDNRGLVDLGDSFSGGSISNGGEVVVRAGVVAEATVSNSGRVRLEGGAELDGLMLQFGDAEVILEPGAELRGPVVTTSPDVRVIVEAGARLLRRPDDFLDPLNGLVGGVLELDGLLGGSGGINGTRIEGGGELSGTAIVDGVLAPGGAATGQLTVTGGLELEGTAIEARVGDGAVDQIHVTGEARLIGAPILAEIDPALSFSRGDFIGVLEAGGGVVEVEPITPLSRGMVPVAVGPDVFLVPDVRQRPVGAAYGLAAKAAVTATWQGGTGSFEDAAAWTLSALPPPDGTGTPTEDSTSLYRVVIESGGAVDVSSDAAIERLGVGAADALVVGSGARVEVGERLDNDGRIDVTAASELGLFEAVNRGELHITGSRAALLGARPPGADGASVENSGILEISDGARLAVEGQLHQTGADAVTRLSGFQFNQVRDVLVEGGRLAVEDEARLLVESLVVRDATLEGNAFVGGIAARIAFGAGGRLSPGGDGIGHLALFGDTRFGEDSTIDITLAGPEESAYDVVSVALSGSGDLAALDGTTVALSTEGFDPQLGDRFDVLRASTLTDTGFSVVLPELGEGLGWVFGIVDGASEDALRFEVVPEPGAAGLLLVGLLLLARSGRPIA